MVNLPNQKKRRETVSFFVCVLLKIYGKLLIFIVELGEHSSFKEVKMSEQSYKTKEIPYSNFKILLDLKENKKQGVNISNEDIDNAYAFAKIAESSYPNLRLAAANIRSMAEDLIGMLLKAENISDEQIREFSRGNQVTLDNKFQYLKQKAKLPQTMIGFLYDIKNVGNSGTHYDSKDDLTDENVRDALIKAQKLAYGFVRFYSNHSFSAFLEAENFIFPNKEGKIVKKVRDNGKVKSQNHDKAPKTDTKKSTPAKAQAKVEQIKSKPQNDLDAQKQKVIGGITSQALPKISEQSKKPQQTTSATPKSVTNSRDVVRISANAEVRSYWDRVQNASQLYNLGYECQNKSDYKMASEYYYKAIQRGHSSAWWALEQLVREKEHLLDKEMVEKFRKWASQAVKERTDDMFSW